MKISPALSRLCDPSERLYVIDLIRSQWLKFPEHHTPDICVQAIKKNVIVPLQQFLSTRVVPRLKHDLVERVIDPLEQFLADEWDKGEFVEGREGWGEMDAKTGQFPDKGPWIEGRWQGRETTATEAARKFLTAAKDIVYRYEHIPPVDCEMWWPCLGIMDESWKEFQVQMGWDGVYEAEQGTEDRIAGADKVNWLRKAKADREAEKIRCFACEIKGGATISRVTTSLHGEFKTINIERLMKELRTEKYGVKLQDTRLREILSPITHPSAKTAPQKPTTQR